MSHLLAGSSYKPAGDEGVPCVCAGAGHVVWQLSGQSGIGGRSFGEADSRWFLWGTKLELESVNGVLLGLMGDQPHLPIQYHCSLQGQQMQGEGLGEGFSCRRSSE